MVIVSEGGTAMNNEDKGVPEIVRAALVQTKWTGDKQSMIESNVALAREAASQGAQVLCFQELFYGPYFCQVQDPEYFSFTESIPRSEERRVGKECRSRGSP